MVKYFLVVIACLVNEAASCQDGPKAIIGKGQTSGVSVMASSNASESNNTLSSAGFLPNHCNASRFLSHASLGVSYDQIDELTHIGIEQWLSDQFAKLQGPSLEQMVREYHEYRKTNSGDPTANQSILFWDFAWWQYHMTQDDLLRQRVAFALSEIFVISRFSDLGSQPLAFASFYDMFLRHAFGNYRELIEEITYHPAMGTYLTFLKNPKTDTTRNRFPDENYGRELMQLFSIGLFELNQDGSYKKDTQGELIATYDNEDISEFSKIFTGLMWGDRPLELNQFFKGRLNDDSYTIPMQMLNEMHEPGVKHLLNGYTTFNHDPPNGVADIDAALDNLFQHPNTGPFICKLLIQRLVTSNPSPAYVARVVAKFNNNGLGERGDLAAVIREILVSPEARDCDAEGDSTYGMLREPFIRYVQIAKAFELTTESGKYRNAQDDIFKRVAQKPFMSPSVFNFFQPDHQPIGPIADADLVAPEFQITNSQSLLAYINGLNNWIVRGRFANEWGLFNGEQVPDNEKSYFPFVVEKNFARENRLLELVDRINMVVAHGKLSRSNTDRIISVLEEIPVRVNNDGSLNETDVEDRVKNAIYLVLSSPEYLINK